MMRTPAEERAVQNGFGHPGWEKPLGPLNVRPDTGGPSTIDYDPDSALVTVTETGTYRVQWAVGANKFILIPVDLDF